MYWQQIEESKTDLENLPVSAKVVVVSKDGKVLVLRKSSGIVDLPGGKVEKGEDLFEAMERELKEEVGFKAKNFQFVTSWVKTNKSLGDRLVIVFEVHLKKKAKKVDIPRRIKIESNANELHIQYRWNRLTGIVSLIFVIIVFAFMGSMLFNEYTNTYIPAINNGELQDAEVLVLPLIVIFQSMLATSFVITSLAQIVNTTRVKVTKHSLHIIQRPLPLRFDVKMNPKDIEGIFTKEHVVEGSGGDQITYEDHVITHDRRRKKLVDRLPEKEQASFIKRQIETFLGIEMIPRSS